MHGRIDHAAEQLQLEVFPFILPASLSINLPHQEEPVTRFMAWQADGLSEPIPIHGAIPPQGAWPILSWFTVSGWTHVLPAGLDHLLFILCLVIPFRRLRGLVGVVGDLLQLKPRGILADRLLLPLTLLSPADCRCCAGGTTATGGSGASGGCWPASTATP